MFDEWVHIWLNRLWVAQLILALTAALASNQLIPKVPTIVHIPTTTTTTTTSLTSIATWNFRFVLVTHSVFYVAECAATPLLNDFPAMFTHHIIAIVIFALFYFLPGNTSVVSILPIAAHSYYWADGTDSIFLLGLYNIVLLLVGSCILFGALTARAWESLRASSWSKASGGSVGKEDARGLGVARSAREWMLGVAALSLFWCNYFIYCSSYRGSGCIANPFEVIDSGVMRVDVWRLAAVVLSSLTGLIVSATAVHVASVVWVDGERAEFAVWLGQERMRNFDGSPLEGCDVAKDGFGLGRWDWKNMRGRCLMRAWVGNDGKCTCNLRHNRKEK